jgi:hypothetical protein
MMDSVLTELGFDESKSDGDSTSDLFFRVEDAGWITESC